LPNARLPTARPLSALPFFTLTEFRRISILLPAALCCCAANSTSLQNIEGEIMAFVNQNGRWRQISPKRSPGNAMTAQAHRSNAVYRGKSWSGKGCCLACFSAVRLFILVCGILFVLRNRWLLGDWHILGKKV